MNFDGLTYREIIEGAYKCLAGERVSPVVEEGRLALCVGCPASRLGIHAAGAVLQCDECKCLLGFVGPGSMIRLRLMGDKGTLERRTRMALSPACKVTVKGERCPRGLW